MEGKGIERCLPAALGVSSGLSSPVTGNGLVGPVKSSLGGLSSEDGVGSVTSVVLGGHTSSGRGGGSLGVGTLLSGSGSSLLGGLTLNLLGVTVEEEVGEDVPAGRTGRASGNGATETKDFSAEEVPHKTDRVTRLVVGGDGNVDKLGGSVSVTEGNDRDVDVGSLSDSLVVNPGVSDDDHSGLLERSGDVVSEGTGGESASDSLGTGEGAVLEDGTVTVGSGGDDTDVVGVLDGSEDTSSKDELLPGLADVDNVDTIGTPLPDVVLHSLVTVLGTEVALSGKEELDVVLSSLKSLGELVGSHFC